MRVNPMALTALLALGTTASFAFAESSAKPVAVIAASAGEPALASPSEPRAAKRSTSPASGFPPAGTDVSPSVGVFELKFMPPVMFTAGGSSQASGDVTLKWSDPAVNPTTGQREVQTELLALTLTGGGVTLSAGSGLGLPATLGKVVPLGPGSDFPALATFNVNFSIKVSNCAGGLPLPIQALSNPQPLVMKAVINEIPPRGIALVSGGSAPLVANLGVNTVPVGSIVSAAHWMCRQPFPPPGVPCPPFLTIPPGTNCRQLCVDDCQPGIRCVVTVNGCNCG